MSHEEKTLKGVEFVEDTPRLLLEGFLGDKVMVKALIQDTKERKGLLRDASSRILSLDEQQTRRFVGLLLEGLSKEDYLWDVNRRDGALELLRLVDFSKIEKETLIDDYEKKVAYLVRALNEKSDTTGVISSLLEAGEIMAPHFPQGKVTKAKIEGIWDDVTEHFMDPQESEFVQEGKERILRQLSPEKKSQSPKVKS